MTEVLFANFLTDKRVYNLAQGTWKRLFDQIAAVHGFSYTPYINQMQGGKKEYDGNPIFSAYVASNNRAVRVIQAAPGGEEPLVSAWIDSIEISEGKAPAEELVLDVVLSKEAREMARKLAEGWLAEGWTTEDIDRVLGLLQ
jgi:hypothetical protein